MSSGGRREAYLAGSGVKPSSDSALRDASYDSARSRISLVASKAIAEASTDEAAVFSEATTASTLAFASAASRLATLAW